MPRTLPLTRDLATPARRGARRPAHARPLLAAIVALCAAATLALPISASDAEVPDMEASVLLEGPV
ncbi:MAG TPA: hypothetical protein VM344_09705, partial [Vitreimonas sp.]|nr:hypothetical protein [Vitreimonas sp.]